MTRRILKLFASLKLTVCCLLFAILLIFLGTIEQANLGLYSIQQKYFFSFLVWFQFPRSSLVLPILPGGYLVGGVLLINLLVAQCTRFSFSLGKSGIYLLHLGILSFLVTLLTDELISERTQMRVDEGQSINFSSSLREKELVFLNTSNPQYDRVVSIPDSLLRQNHVLSLPLPFKIRINKYFENSTLIQNESEHNAAGSTILVSLPLSEKSEVNIASTEINVLFNDGTEKLLVLSEGIVGKETIYFEGSEWKVALRAKRFYTDYSIGLQDFVRETYPGTNIPRNFVSRILISNNKTGERREGSISMNAPLRYQGYTYYQSAFGNDDTTSIFNVSRNTLWILPYLSFGLVVIGLLFHFGFRLVFHKHKHGVI